MKRKERRNIHQRAALLQAVVNSVVQNPSVTLTVERMFRGRRLAGALNPSVVNGVFWILPPRGVQTRRFAPPRSIRVVNCREVRP